MTTTKTLSEAIAARTAAHNEANILLSEIETAQTAIEAHQKEINKLNPAVSYYAAVSGFHLSEIERQVEIRNEATNKYERLMWKIYSASLPSFRTTGIQEVAVTLYTPAINSTIAIN